ncbi:hypothetical protein Syun_029306 [Stephania yunnanensis]|uniref:Uncharacterized protein n=1 Tax=Stephania yunnanensis TaxID=152371 RepID=A0AAP0E9P5_9MAGN
MNTIIESYHHLETQSTISLMVFEVVHQGCGIRLPVSLGVSLCRLSRWSPFLRLVVLPGLSLVSVSPSLWSLRLVAPVSVIADISRFSLGLSIRIRQLRYTEDKWTMNVLRTMVVSEVGVVGIVEAMSLVGVTEALGRGLGAYRDVSKSILNEMSHLNQVKFYYHPLTFNTFVRNDIRKYTNLIVCSYRCIFYHKVQQINKEAIIFSDPNSMHDQLMMTN